MRHTYGLIAGASALALAGVLSVRSGLFDASGSPAEPPAAAPAEVAVAAPEPPAAAPEPPAPAPPLPEVAELEDRIATLETTLADREAALAVLGETLSARDASLAEMTAALADRDAELAALRDELADLRLELADLRDRFAFDIQLAAMKAGEPADPAAAPPAAAGTAPADPAPAAAEQPLTTVQFDTGSARLSPGGQVHAAAAAVMLADMKLGSVRLVGFTDRTGSPARNRVLAAERARAVADFLVAQGVPAGLIETAAVTEGALPVPTDPGVPEPLNRSVSIVAVPLPTT
jgi:outer membrane protein OmpA-like peptidoglycan-associated protein